MESHAIEARIISQWLETRRTDWVKVSPHWKEMADSRLAAQLCEMLDMSRETASRYTEELVDRYRRKGWIR